LKKHNIIPFIENILNSFEPLLIYKSIKLKFTTSYDTFELYYDEDKLEKVLSNLLSNAVKFTNPNGRIEVKFAVAEDKKTAALEVVNIGRGIPEDEKELIFMPFEQ